MIVVTDNDVLFNGSSAPDCMNVPSSFEIHFINELSDGFTRIRYEAFREDGSLTSMGNIIVGPNLPEVLALFDELFQEASTIEIGVVDRPNLISVKIVRSAP